METELWYNCRERKQAQREYRYQGARLKTPRKRKMIDRNSPTVLIRVWMLGAFQVERRNEDGTWETVDKAKWEKSYARLLFKRLLCSSGRRAQRNTLIDDLWPDPGSPELVERYLNDAAYHLRKVPRAADLLKTFGNASGYKLADQSLIWMDVDEFETLMREAEKIGRKSAPALRLLEQAKEYIDRGELLESEGGLWCHARRGTFERMRYLCHIWLAEAYEQQEMVGQAEMQYSRLLEDDPIDEDVLCRLIAFFHRQGMTQQAQRCYEEAKQRFKQDGLQLSSATDAFIESLLNKPRQIEFYFAQETLKPLSFEHNQRQIALPSTTLNIIEDDNDRVDANKASLKVQTLEQLSERLTSLNTDREILDFFEKLTETCRHLSEGNELKTTERILWAYLPRIETIAKLSFEDQKKAADIASQGYLLAASLAGHRNDLQARHHCSEQALLYGKLAEDRNLQIAALRQLSITFDYLGHPEKVLQIYQQAFPYLDETSPLLRACIYADVSGAYAQLQQKQEAFRFLGLAYEHFPEIPDNEPNFLHTICRYSTLILCDGLHHLSFGQPDKAKKIFARIDGLQPKIPMPERVRIDLLNCQVEVFIALREREQARDYLEAAVKAAIAIGSDRRLQESFAVFQQMLKVWNDKPQVQDLSDLFMQRMINHTH